MKRFFVLIFDFLLLAFAFAESKKPLFSYSEMLFSAKTTLVRDDSGKADSISAAAGTKIAFKNADFRAFASLPKTPLDSVSADSLDSPRFGGAIFLFQKSVPISLKAGNLLFSRSLSRVKSPAPSQSANAIPQFSAQTFGLGAALPNLSSAKKPLSLFFSAQIFEIFSLESLFDEDKNFAALLSNRTKIGRNSAVSSSILFSRAFVQNESATLKKAGAAVSGDFRAAVLAELSFKSPFFLANLRSGANESPFSNGIDSWIFAESRAAAGFFSLGASIFAIPTKDSAPKAAPLIGQNSSVVRTFQQISINPQCAFFVGRTDFRLGVCAISAKKITSTKIPQEFEVGKIGSSLEISRGILVFKADFSHSNVLISGNPPNKSQTPQEFFDYRASLSFKPKNFSIFAKADLKIEPPYSEKYEEIRTLNANISVSPVKKRNLYVQSGFSSSFKGGKLNTRVISGALSFKSKGKVRFSGKAAFELKI